MAKHLTCETRYRSFQGKCFARTLIVNRSLRSRLHHKSSHVKFGRWSFFFQKDYSLMYNHFGDLCEQQPHK